MAYLLVELVLWQSAHGQLLTGDLLDGLLLGTQNNNDNTIDTHTESTRLTCKGTVIPSTLIQRNYQQQ